MKLENCLKCNYHKDYINGQILCKFSNNSNSVATYTEEKTSEVFVVGCPKGE
jgi:hypothetical protein